MNRGRAKLTPDQVRKIRQRYEETDASQYDLAREYGVQQSTINYVVNRKTWRTL